MNKISFIIVLFVIGGMPLAFGHADPIGVRLITDGQELYISNSFNTEEEEKNIESDDVEFLSITWLWNHFILILISLIIAILIPVFIIPFKKELFRQKHTQPFSMFHI